jgi:hypothetical protein
VSAYRLGLTGDARCDRSALRAPEEPRLQSRQSALNCTTLGAFGGASMWRLKLLPAILRSFDVAEDEATVGADLGRHRRGTADLAARHNPSLRRRLDPSPDRQ